MAIIGNNRTRYNQTSVAKPPDLGFYYHLYGPKVDGQPLFPYDSPQQRQPSYAKLDSGPRNLNNVPWWTGNRLSNPNFKRRCSVQKKEVYSPWMGVTRSKGLLDFKPKPALTSAPEPPIQNVQLEAQNTLPHHCLSNGLFGPNCFLIVVLTVIMFFAWS